MGWGLLLLVGALSPVNHTGLHQGWGKMYTAEKEIGKKKGGGGEGRENNYRHVEEESPYQQRLRGVKADGCVRQAGQERTS